MNEVTIKIVKKFEKSLEKQLTREKRYAKITLAHVYKGESAELLLGSRRLKIE